MLSFHQLRPAQIIYKKAAVASQPYRSEDHRWVPMDAESTAVFKYRGARSADLTLPKDIRWQEEAKQELVARW